MRSLLALLLWLVTTVLLAVSVPALWTQHNIVSVDGYSDLAAGAARSPALQQPMAAELTAQVSGATGSSGVQATLLEAAANSYTSSPVFPGQFAAVNRVAHRWLFTDDAQGQWVVDLSPMLADSSIRQTLDGFGVQVPTSSAGSGDRERIRRSATRPVASGRAVGPVGQRRGGGAGRRVRPVDPRGVPSAGQNVCRAGGFGAAGRCGRLGRVSRSVAATSTMR